MTDEKKQIEVINARIEIAKQYKSKSKHQLIRDLKEERKKITGKN